MANELLDVLRVLLLVLLALPAAAAVVVAVLGPERAGPIRLISLAAVGLDLVLAVILIAGFMSLPRDDVSNQSGTHTFMPEIVPGAGPENPHATTWQLIGFGSGDAQQLPASPGMQFYVGLDGLNVWLVALTAVLMVSAVLISWRAITERVNEYYAWLLALGTAMLGVFLSFDIILFYVFFELTLVPLFFLIGIWGGPERRYAARKFFIYTLTGGLLTLLGVLAVVFVCYYDTRRDQPLTFSIPELARLVNEKLNSTSLQNPAFWQVFQVWVFLALMAGFAIKVPLVPFHTWLPLAHTEAPTAGSVLLAGVLLKIGAYGFLRLCLPLAPDASLSLGVPLIGTLAVVGIIYGALCAFAQDDIKKLVAYSSVSHLGFCMLGMFALNQAGLTGSLLQMINHGLSTGALFLLVGMLYERYHTRKTVDYGGMGARLGLLAACFVFISLSSIGLPGLNGFVGEALVFFGMFEVHRPLAIVGTAGIILGAWYLLTLVKRVFFGPVQEPAAEGHEVSDLSPREWASLAPIMLLCIVLGVYPQPVIETSRPDLQVISDLLGQRREARAAAQLPEAPTKHLASGRGGETPPLPVGRLDRRGEVSPPRPPAARWESEKRR
jgi:NADH-quinone oxidoreductase subunit M